MATLELLHSCSALHTEAWVSLWLFSFPPLVAPDDHLKDRTAGQGWSRAWGKLYLFSSPAVTSTGLWGGALGLFFSRGDDTFKWAGRTNRNLHASQVFSGFKRRHAVIQIKAGDKKAQILLVQILVFLPLLVYVPLLSQCCDLAWQCRVGERAEDTWKYLICHRLAMLPPPPPPKGRQENIKNYATFWHKKHQLFGRRHENNKRVRHKK